MKKILFFLKFEIFLGFKNLLLAAFGLLFLTACAINSPSQSRAVQLSISSPLLKYNDIAFIKQSGKNFTLELYSSGVPVESIKSKGGQICMKMLCVDALEFNRRFFGAEYYADLLFDVLFKKALFNAQNLSQDDEGFYQNISKFSIRYKFNKDKTSFFAEKNRTKIVIKELK